MKSKLRKATKEDFASYSKPFVPVTGEEVELLIDIEGSQLPKYSMLKLTKDGMLMQDGVKKSIGKLEDHIETLFVPDDEIEYDINYFERMLEDEEENVDPSTLGPEFAKYKSVPNFDLITRSILKIVDEHQDYLCQPENLDQLAYIMFRWENLFYAARYCYGYKDEGAILPLMYCTNNPKYEIEDLGNTDEKRDLIYDAWAVNLDIIGMIPDSMRLYRWNHMRFTEDDLNSITPPDLTDDFYRLLHKSNKTMDEWYAVLGNPKYEYHSIYRTKKAIDDHLLCVIGNGYGWNKEGFLCNDGPSGNDNDSYGFYLGAKDKLRKDIHDQLFAILLTPGVQDCQNKAKEIQRKHWEKFIEKEFNSKTERRMLFFIIDLERGQTTENKYDDPALQLAIEAYKEKCPNTTLTEMMNAGSEEDVDTMIKELEKLTKEKLKSLTIEEKVRSLIAEDRRLEEWSAEREKDPEQGRPLGDYYPLSNYSRMCSMPDNAHPSYVDAVRRICTEIVEHGPALIAACSSPESKIVQKEMKKQHAENNIKVAKKILSKIGQHEKVD